LKRAYAKRGVRHKRNPAGGPAAPSGTDRQVQLPLDRDELLALMQDSLDGLAVELGLLVAAALLEDEVTRLCGARYERRPGRAHTRYGRQGGAVTLGGRKLPIDRPRVRRADGGGEVPLETYAKLRSPEAMPQAVLRRMVRGVSTREYEEVIDMAREGFGVDRSGVSRQFVRASAADVRALAERQFEGEHFAVVMIDGVEYAGETMIEALGITADGTKRVLGLRQGATTNPIESAPSVTWRVTARVTRWRDGDMRRRWCVAGLLRAEGKFRRLKGHRAMPTLLRALESLVREREAGNGREVA
jgi:transposase-like protein